MREHKKLERLMLFSEVALTLSFTSAAERLGISRGYLSDQIKELEKSLGSPLLIRSTRSVMLTPEGQRVLEDMTQIRESLLKLERHIQHERESLEGTLRITAPLMFSQNLLLDICQAFHEQHPEITFSIDSSYVSHDLTKENFDLAFRATNTPPQNMIAKPLFAYRHLCAASPDYLDKFGRPLSPQDLKHHQCLKGPNQPTWNFKNEDTQISGWIELNDNQALVFQARSGQGIIRLPEYVLSKDIESGTLEAVLNNECVSGQTIYIIHPQLIHQSARLKAFIQFTQQWFSEHAMAKTP